MDLQSASIFQTAALLDQLLASSVARQVQTGPEVLSSPQKLPQIPFISAYPPNPFIPNDRACLSQPLNVIYQPSQPTSNLLHPFVSFHHPGTPSAALAHPSSPSVHHPQRLLPRGDPFCSQMFYSSRAKRIRTAFSVDQLSKLEDQFQRNPYVVGHQRRQISEDLGLSETQVKVWFQNRRTKEKRIKPVSENEDEIQSESETESTFSENQKPENKILTVTPDKSDTVNESYENNSEKIIPERTDCSKENTLKKKKRVSKEKKKRANETGEFPTKLSKSFISTQKPQNDCSPLDSDIPSV